MSLSLDNIRATLAQHQPEALLDKRIVKRSAVAIVLRPNSTGVNALFIRRSEHDADPWSGHMAFPGGREEKTDDNLLQTAIRETREEVGLTLSPLERLGQLDDIEATNRSGRTGLLIRPFVFAVSSSPELTFNHEVAEAVWFDVGLLRSGAVDTEFPLKRSGQVLRFPAYDLEGRTVWGLTYRMLHLLFASLSADLRQGATLEAEHG